MQQAHQFRPSQLADSFDCIDDSIFTDQTDPDPI